MLSFLHVVNITLPDGSVGNVISLVLCMSPFPTSIQLFLFVCFVLFFVFSTGLGMEAILYLRFENISNSCSCL